MARSLNNALEFSSAGSVIIGPTDTATGNFGAIQFLRDSTISSTVNTNIDESMVDLDGAFGAGTILYGHFTSVTLGGSTGMVAVHKF
tara:strand:+ start:3003 stop:3263 length:261 start_codon:yes stop_codon:yes gene_type:complete